MAPISEKQCLWIPGADLMRTEAPASTVPSTSSPTGPMAPPEETGTTVISRAGKDSAQCKTQNEAGKFSHFASCTPVSSRKGLFPLRTVVGADDSRAEQPYRSSLD